MRGGSRLNAGRKPLLTNLERLWVGVQCEDAFRAAAQAKQQAEVDRVFAQSDYAAVIAKVQAIPVHLRFAWLQSEEFEQHRDDVELESHAIAGTDMDEGQAAPRIVTIPPQKPTGVRRNIIATVAEDWSKRIGKPISKSTVTRCWEEARAMHRAITESEENEPIL